MLNKIKSIDAFNAAYNKDASEYCKTEARILNSFLIALESRGYKIQCVNDGEEYHDIKDNNRFEALYHIFSVDQSFIKISPPELFASSIVLYLLLGEGEAQTIYDHSEMTDEQEELIFSLWAGAVRTHDAALYRDYWA